MTLKIAILATFAIVVVLVFFFWMMSQIYYRIGSRHLKIMLWGIPVRKYSLTSIIHVTKRRPKGLAAHWYNTIKPSHRLLTIERSRGLIKFICITPRNRYVFMADLKNAARRLNPGADLTNFAEGFEPETTFQTSPKSPSGAEASTS